MVRKCNIRPLRVQRTHTVRFINIKLRSWELRKNPVHTCNKMENKPHFIAQCVCELVLFLWIMYEMRFSFSGKYLNYGCWIHMCVCVQLAILFGLAFAFFFSIFFFWSACVSFFVFSPQYEWTTEWVSKWECCRIKTPSNLIEWKMNDIKRKEFQSASCRNAKFESLPIYSVDWKFLFTSVLVCSLSLLVHSLTFYLCRSHHKYS